jgi:hypothetical protein
MTEHDFNEWFEKTNLGTLEDVRVFVGLHAIDNCADVPASEDPWKCAQATVLMYLDDPDCAEVFETYRT